MVKNVRKNLWTETPRNRYFKLFVKVLYRNR